jgi:hypothetical protein
VPPDFLIVQIGFASLVAAALAPDLRWVRVLLGLAAFLGLAHALLWTGDGVAAIWMALLLVACLVLLGRDLWVAGQVRFSAEEERMRTSLLAGLSRGKARHLIDQGLWLSGGDGDTLTREGEPVGHLYWLESGEARVTSSGRQVGTCSAGDLIGELTVLSGESASATVTLTGPARFWCAPAAVLRPYLDANDDVRRVLERGFSAALKAKLRATNRTIAESGERAPA